MGSQAERGTKSASTTGLLETAAFPTLAPETLADPWLWRSRGSGKYGESPPTAPYTARVRARQGTRGRFSLWSTVCGSGLKRSLAGLARGPGPEY